jgi:hypothetical protein
MGNTYFRIAEVLDEDGDQGCDLCLHFGRRFVYFWHQVVEHLVCFHQSIHVAFVHEQARPQTLKDLSQVRASADWR